MTIGTYEYQSDFARRHFAEGYAKGLAKAILLILEARAVMVPDAARDRIRECRDSALLDEWVCRAVTAESVDDLFS